MCYNEDYNKYLDLCLDIFSEKKYELIIRSILSKKRGDWIKLKNVTEEILDIHEDIFFLWINIPGDYETKIIFFMDKSTLEIVNVIYYK